MKQPDNDVRDTVLLVAFGKDGRVLEKRTLSYEEYYEDLSDLIDSDEYRARKGIAKITGLLFNSSGEVEQQFETHYSEQGKYLRGKAVHQNGTVTE